ncbi:unnamed protein product [Amoebophrya sp. A120]|nr:unnamed protein product [Amoebophrya sp. A120]|eukprot:GSA120T00024715001.1
MRTRRTLALPCPRRRPRIRIPGKKSASWWLRLQRRATRWTTGAVQFALFLLPLLLPFLSLRCF